MKLFKKREMPPERRTANVLGRTNAFTYHSRRSQEQAMLGRQLFRETINRNNAKRAGRYWARRFGLLAVIVVAAVSTVSILELSSDPKVVQLEPNHNRYLHSLTEYERAAQAQFAGSLLNKDKITVDANGISAALKRQFPELTLVTVELPLIGHRPIVYIEPAKAELLLLTMRGASYVIDENGRAIGSGGKATAEELGLLNISDQSGTVINIGQQALPSDTADFIRTMLYQMGKKGLTVSTLVLPAGKSELDVYLQGQRYFVKYNLQSGMALQQIGTFLATKHNLEGRGITPSQYIDVRVDGRAYYK